jgi:hypothetical protein
MKMKKKKIMNGIKWLEKLKKVSKELKMKILVKINKSLKT